MVMGHSRLAPNTVTFTVPSNSALTYTILLAEFATEVVGVQMATTADVASNATNYFTATVQKVDTTFNTTRAIASLTNNGTAWTAGVPKDAAISQAEDSTNYTPPTYPLPQPYRTLRPGDRLQVAVTTNGASPPNTTLVVTVRYIESAQQSGRGAF
jgi:hypothetical protein